MPKEVAIVLGAVRAKLSEIALGLPVSVAAALNNDHNSHDAQEHELLLLREPRAAEGGPALQHEDHLAGGEDQELLA
jgi:hypothetical protein